MKKRKKKRQQKKKEKNRKNGELRKIGLASAAVAESARLAGGLEGAG
jgi:hypothetical protein